MPDLRKTELKKPGTTNFATAFYPSEVITTILQGEPGSLQDLSLKGSPGANFANDWDEEEKSHWEETASPRLAYL